MGHMFNKSNKIEKKNVGVENKCISLLKKDLFFVILEIYLIEINQKKL